MVLIKYVYPIWNRRSSSPIIKVTKTIKRHDNIKRITLKNNIIKTKFRRMMKCLDCRFRLCTKRIFWVKVTNPSTQDNTPEFLSMQEVIVFPSLNATSKLTLRSPNIGFHIVMIGWGWTLLPFLAVVALQYIREFLLTILDAFWPSLRAPPFILYFESSRCVLKTLLGSVSSFPSQSQVEGANYFLQEI